MENLKNVSRKQLAKMMDHSLLKPEMTESVIIEGCKEALALDVASVCIRPSDVGVAFKILKSSDVHLSTVIGFPHGTTTTATKVAEAIEAIEAGCSELDMVVNIGAVKSGNWEIVTKDIEAVVACTHARGAKLKVIFENCFLETGEKLQLCKICSELKVDWVKTSTGFGTGGAIDEDLILMRDNSSPDVQVKAAGGVRTLERALRVRELGCTRFGCTVSKSILDEYGKALQK